MELSQIVKECQKVAAAGGVEITVPITLNGRLKSCLGRVSYEWANCSKNEVRPTKIEFSRDYANNASDAEVIQIVRHEMTHYILSVKTKHQHGHDELFKALNKELGGDGSRTTNVPEGIMHPKYTVYCKECGKVIGKYYRAGKVVKHPELFLSRCCQGALRVEQNY